MSAKQHIHVIPVGHLEPLHIAGADCWCQPLQESDRLHVHHAKDGREKYERQGIISREKYWVLVYGPMLEPLNDKLSDGTNNQKL